MTIYTHCQVPTFVRREPQLFIYADIDIYADIIHTFAKRQYSPDGDCHSRTYMRMRAYTHTHKQTYKRMRACIHTHIGTCVHTYKYIHTYIQLPSADIHRTRSLSQHARS